MRDVPQSAAQPLRRLPAGLRAAARLPGAGPRGLWAEYAVAPLASTRADRLVAEHRTALAGVISVPPRPVPTDEAREAFVLEVDGTVHVCPVQSRLRSWVALGQFRDGLPDTLLHAFVPPASLARADADHARWGTDRGRLSAAHPHRHLVGAGAVVRAVRAGRPW